MTKHTSIMIYLLEVLLLIVPFQTAISQIEDDELVIRPHEIDEVLSNPGMGFMTFQRFNGDLLNEGSGWTEGFPIDYQEFDLLKLEQDIDLLKEGSKAVSISKSQEPESNNP